MKHMKMHNFISVALTLLVIGFVNSGFVIDDKFEKAMKKNIELLYQAKSVDEYQPVVNSFERIGEAEKKFWEPYYYAGFGYIMMATKTQEGTKKDSCLDLAIAAVDKGKAIAPAESELVALEGFVHMIRVSVDPPSRGPQYAGLSMQSLNKAVAMNPENPRAYALLGQMQFGTAQFFGSEPTEACASLRKAMEKFANYTTENTLAPVWGKGMVESLVANCK
jgi:hypothetical protein